MYALLCGELPFDEDVESDTKMKILNDEPKYPADIPEGVAISFKLGFEADPSRCGIASQGYAPEKAKLATDLVRTLSPSVSGRTCAATTSHPCRPSPTGLYHEAGKRLFASNEGCRCGH